jgi:predicted amidohydrolase YtcJ
MAGLLIRGAEIWQFGAADLRIADGKIAEIGQLEPHSGETVLEAHGGALLPGLHDHHIHLAATAVRASSVQCGPPEVTNAEELATALRSSGAGWIRGIGYHESVMGLPEAQALDVILPDRPLRIQHRSGRMWLFNSLALQVLLANSSPPPGLEKEGERFTGRLFDEDSWLRAALGSEPPEFGGVSRELASFGVTGITDMSPRNDLAMAAHFTAEAERGALQQHCMLAGTLSLADCKEHPRWRLGPAKLHLHENAMPDLDETVSFIISAHEQGRALASHCTTETELVFTLAAIEAAGVRPGDRIEHAGIAPDHLVDEIARLGLAVVSQPHFVAERGDQYLQAVDPTYHDALYRLRVFRDAGVTLAAGSDAPFGSTDPWEAMAAAVSRRTRAGQTIGSNEALSPEQALELFLAAPDDLSSRRRIALGEPADLCLLDRPWSEARLRLSSDDVLATIIGGAVVHHRIDDAPCERLPG